MVRPYVRFRQPKPAPGIRTAPAAIDQGVPDGSRLLGGLLAGKEQDTLEAVSEGLDSSFLERIHGGSSRLCRS